MRMYMPALMRVCVMHAHVRAGVSMMHVRGPVCMCFYVNVQVRVLARACMSILRFCATVCTPRPMLC